MTPTDERGSDQPDADDPAGGLLAAELLVIVVVVAVALALLLPAIQHWREASRRMACQANLEANRLGDPQLQRRRQKFSTGDGLHQPPIQPGNQYDVWKEAAGTGVGTAAKPGPQGTGFLLRIIFYMEGDSMGWQNSRGIGLRGKYQDHRRECNRDYGAAQPHKLRLPQPT